MCQRLHARTRNARTVVNADALGLPGLEGGNSTYGGLKHWRLKARCSRLNVSSSRLKAQPGLSKSVPSGIANLLATISYNPSGPTTVLLWAMILQAVEISSVATAISYGGSFQPARAGVFEELSHPYDHCLVITYVDLHTYYVKI